MDTIWGGGFRNPDIFKRAICTSKVHEMDRICGTQGRDKHIRSLERKT
jgi:hypothetical protein